MNYHLISLHGRDSSKLPFVLIQMEAFERAVGEIATTKRFLLSEIQSERFTRSKADKIFLFGLGTLENDRDDLFSQIRTLPNQTHLIAVENPKNGDFTELEKLLIKEVVANSGEITAISEKAREAIQKVEPLAQVKVLGCLESLLDINPVSSTLSYVALCGVPKGFSVSEPSIQIHFSLIEDGEKNEIGLTDLYVSSFPWVGLKAMATASGVITSKEEIARIAVCLGKNLTFLKDKQSDFCIDSLRVELPKQKENWRTYLDLAGKAPPRAQVLEEENPLKLALVCDRRYLGFLIALCENLLEVHDGQIEVFLLWLSDLSQFPLKNRFPAIKFNVFEPKDIWSEDKLIRISKWPMAEQAYAGKPAILKKAISLAHSPVLLSDLDIWYFSSPHRLFNLPTNKSVVVFPQWADRFQWLRHHGFINSGMVVAKPGSERILEFWSNACAESSALSLPLGLFGDQGYLDYAVMSYEDCFIYRKGDEDVAPWNRQTLKFVSPEIGKAKFEVCDGIEVRSFHAAGPDSSGAFELKYLWDQLCSVFNLSEDELQRTPMWENTLHQQRCHCSFLNTLISMNERWRRRFPRLFSYKVDSIEKWKSSVRNKVLAFVESSTRLFDQMRNRKTGLTENFDPSWRGLHHLIVRDTRSGT